MRMRINTSRFGDVEIADEKLLTFKQGIPGFDQVKRFALISSEDTEPFHWLQAIEMPEIALAVINPFLVLPEYAPRISESIMRDLGSPGDEDILILAVSVIPNDVNLMTANFVSPVIINSANNEGCQVILEGSDYQIRHPIYEAVRGLLNGGAPCWY
jgi:flagellar assembly factor FliW